MKELFYIGQEVTPIIKGTWNIVPGTGERHSEQQPKVGKVYTVSGYDIPEGNINFVFLEEISDKDSFDERGFAPVMSTEQLTNELETIKEPQTI